MSIVLRVSGAGLDVDTGMSWIPADRIEARWRAGEKFGRRTMTTAGFNLLLADDNDEIVLASAQTLLNELAAPLVELVSSGVRVEVDVALFVHAQGSRSVRFPPDILAAVLAAGAALRVSGYPTADD